MLTIALPAIDEFESIELHLEHSLVSVSKWESIHEKPFFGKGEMSTLETVSYIKQMMLYVPSETSWLARLQTEHYDEITQYINSNQTATWFREQQERTKANEVVTSELIYYWMVGFNIPFQPCENWHLNRLMTLIKICGLKQSKPKKMNKQAWAQEQQRLNALRRQQLGTSG